MKLFKVETTTEEYDCCKDVTFMWYYADARKARRPYARLIEDYEPNNEHST